MIENRSLTSSPLVYHISPHSFRHQEKFTDGTATPLLFFFWGGWTVWIFMPYFSKPTLNRQEPMSWSMQLNYIPAKAFSYTNLFLDRISLE